MNRRHLSDLHIVSEIRRFQSDGDLIIPGSSVFP